MVMMTGRINPDPDAAWRAWQRAQAEKQLALQIAKRICDELVRRGALEIFFENEAGDRLYIVARRGVR